MKKFFTSIAMALLLTGGMFSTLSAQAGQFGMQRQMGSSNSQMMNGGGFNAQNSMLVRILNLSQDQISMMRALRQQQRMAFIRDSGDYENPMFMAVKSGKFDKKAFEAAYMANCRKAMQRQVHSMQGFLSILTPKQKQKFYAFMKNRMRMRLEGMKMEEQSLKMRINRFKTMLNQ